MLVTRPRLLGCGATGRTDSARVHLLDASISSTMLTATWLRKEPYQCQKPPPDWP